MFSISGIVTGVEETGYAGKYILQYAWAVSLFGTQAHTGYVISIGGNVALRVSSDSIASPLLHQRMAW